MKHDVVSWGDTSAKVVFALRVAVILTSTMGILARSEPLTGHLATLWQWSVSKSRWTSSRARLMSVSPAPVAYGGMRRVFRAVARHHDDNGALTNVLLKEFDKEHRKSDDNEELCWEISKMQAEAAQMAEQFNRSISKTNRNIVGAVGVLCSWVVEIEGFGVVGTMEDMLHGEWNKWNDNRGGVKGDHHDAEIANCFSHWTWLVSGGDLVVVDIQGVGGMLTDVVVHRKGDGKTRRRLGCRGEKGIFSFIKSHTCGSACAAAGLALMRNGVENPPGVGLWTTTATARDTSFVAGENGEAAISRTATVSQTSIINEWLPTVIGAGSQQSSLCTNDTLYGPGWTT